jgi:D-threo-aldose 1-dehydrogenase
MRVRHRCGCARLRRQQRVNVREAFEPGRHLSVISGSSYSQSMRTLVIPGTALQTSRFIFGTSSLLSAGSRQTRRRLLETAVEQGFIHFDTAPYYGFGLAERDLAPLLKTQPDLRVTTKVGIYSRGGEEQPTAAVVARKLGARVFPSLTRPTKSFDLTLAQRSLEGSLRRLGRDYIDLYMLHEPEINQVAIDDWVDWLEDCRRRGSIRYFGLALTSERLEPFLSAPSALVDVVQVLDSLDARQADILVEYRRPLQITYGYVSSARASGETQSTEEILRRAMARNPYGPIIVSTRKVQRVVQYGRLQEAVID